MAFTLKTNPSTPAATLFHSKSDLFSLNPKFHANRKPNSNRKIVAILEKKKARKPIDGVNEELNSIASQVLDFAPARRIVRSAFIQAQQELNHPLFKLAPTGIRTEEWYEKNSKGLEIFCKSWMPEEGTTIKGVVSFCHGYGDTCTFFFDGIAKRIAVAGYAVYAVDHPGFGLSEGLHGYIPSFDEIVNNVIERYTKIAGRPEISKLPRFLLGQSMGGAVAIKAHLKRPTEWDGVILVAPMCKIAADMIPSPAILMLLTILSNFFPKAKLVPEQDIGELAFRQADKLKLAEYNVTCYSDRTRLKTAMELLKATKEIESQVDKVSSPLLVIHGAADKVTDPLVSQFLYDKASSKDKTLKIYPEGYHCILEGEPDERIYTVLSDIVSWLDSRCSLN